MTRRRTQARLAIAAELLSGQDQVHWGYELSRNSGVGAGSMYPFLSELLGRGFLTDGWEDVQEIRGRPPRRFYRVTDAGKEFLVEFLTASPGRQARAPQSSLKPKTVRS